MNRFNKHRRLRACAVISVFLLTFSCSAYGQHEFLVFPSVEGQKDVSSNSTDTTDGIVAADVVYSYTNNRFRLLVEYLLSNKEQELERLQLGWEITEESMLWFGRFHSPMNYWNTEFHHGKYLQTSISRPAISEFEDQGGIIPAHVFGVMLNAGQLLGEQSHFDIGVSAGLGPRLTAEGLEPLDLLDFDDITEHYGLSAGLRLAYMADYVLENQVGILLSYSDIFVDDNLPPPLPDIHEFDQISIGIFGDWHFGNWRLIGNITRVQNQAEATVTSTDSFVAGYLNAEYELSEHWTFFGRLEDSSGTEDSLYFEFFPEFVSAKILAGARYDFLKRHALTLEVADVETRYDDFGQILLQWSAFFP
jgi:hypothetical protein